MSGRHNLRLILASKCYQTSCPQRFFSTDVWLWEFLNFRTCSAKFSWFLQIFALEWSVDIFNTAQISNFSTSVQSLCICFCFTLNYLNLGQLQSWECWKSWPPWWWNLQFLLLTFISRVWSFDINDKINLKRKKMISMPLMENPVRKPMVPQWDSAGWYAMHHNKNILEKLYRSPNIYQSCINCINGLPDPNVCLKVIWLHEQALELCQASNTNTNTWAKVLLSSHSTPTIPPILVFLKTNLPCQV